MGSILTEEGRLKGEVSRAEYIFLKVYLLKVHKNENFFGFDLEFCTISMLVMDKKLDFGEKFFDWTIMGGATIISRCLKTTRNEKTFQDRPKFIYFLNHI